MTFPRPNNFPYKNVFYSDGQIALMKGRYKNSAHESIGMRWMVGESDMGYPSTYGKPMWMVVPEKIARYILEGISRDQKEQEFIIDLQEFREALKLISP
jgi:hypothetical protein